MYKDSGSNHNLGFGVPIWGSPEVEEGLPNSGNPNLVQRALYGDPVFKFFAVATASLVSAHLAGKVVREGGLRIGAEAQKLAKQESKIGRSVSGGIKSFRRIQSELDALQGINRATVDPTDPSILVKRSENGRGWVRDKVDQFDNATIRAETRQGNRDIPAWMLRDEIQQRLVAQARRLPYELPGFYAADKVLLDPLFGNDQDRKVNWSNPVDVLGDFAYESVKNTAFNVLPFEVGLAGGKQSARKLMDHVANNPTNSPGLVSLRETLEMVGADVTDVLNRGIKFSHQSMGAFSQLVQDASDNSRTFKQYVKEQSSSSTIKRTKPIGNSNAAGRSHEQNKETLHNKNLFKHGIDTMPGPFKGMGTALAMAKQNFKNIGDTYDDWQDVITGRVSMDRLHKTNPARAQRVEAFMQKGGGTYLEQFANASHTLGNGGPTFPDGKINPDWKDGQFYRQRSQQVYQAQVVEALQKQTGLRHSEAAKFVRLSDRVSPLSGGKGSYPEGENLMERIQFGKSKDYSTNTTEWWDSIVRGATDQGIRFGPDKITLTSFQQAIKQADVTYGSRSFKEVMDSNIAGQWNHLHGQVLPGFAGKSMSTGRMPYENFANSSMGNDSTKAFLLRRTAQRLGINIADETGNPINHNTLKEQVRLRGLNPNDPYQLRGYLVKNKDISSPWATGGKNIFGIRSMSLQEGMENGYFAGNNEAVQKEISSIVNQKTFQNSVGRGGNMYADAAETRQAAKLGRVYVNSSGNVLDLGKVRRSLTATMDTLASDVQIPLLHFNPLQLMFHKKYQQMRNASPINIVSANSLQPGGVLGESADFYTLIKTSAKSSKGKVVGIRGDELSGFTSEVSRGTYRPTLTNAGSIGGRYSRLFTGESGVPGSETHQAPQNATNLQLGLTKLKRSFDVSRDQRDSLVFGENSVINRIRRSTGRTASGARRSYTNPHRMAEALADPGFSIGSLNPNMAKGFDNLTDEARNNDFSPRALRNILRDGPEELRRTFEGILSSLDSAKGFSSLDEIPDELLPGITEELIRKDLSTFKSMGERYLTQGSRAQNNLKNLLKQGKEQNQYWDLPAPNAARSVGISRRMDQLRNEITDYIIGTTDFRPTGGPSFLNTVTDLIGSVESMFKKGTISAAERSEARTAILSLQIERARNVTYSAFDEVNPYSNFKHNKEAISALLTDKENYTNVQELMDEFAQFKTKGNIVTRPIRKRVSIDPYEIDNEVNPFGSNIVFEPTFGTAYQNNRRKAMMGVAGLSWDEQAYSGAAIPATHMVMRLNRYFETFGVGLDPTKYKSPVDLFARGMVGKRVAPAYIAGATLYNIDATLGGIVNKDDEGNRVYSPLIMGVGADVIAKGQIGLAGAIPGGQTAAEKEEELTTGQVPIRQGRWWSMGNTPWKGGRIQYFRPSWYQRFKAGPEYTPEMNQTPLEKLAFGYDFSPLRPLDPYRFERQNAETRPYPISGDYFTGPFGPVTPALNATLGRVLKPRRQLVEDSDLNYLMQQYQPVGESGAYFSPSPVLSGASDIQSSINTSYAQAGPGTSSGSVFGQAMGYAPSRGAASMEVRGRAEQISAMYADVAQTPGSYVGVYDALVPYGVPRVGGMAPRVISNAPMMNYGSGENQLRRMGYATQEMAGIYGFGFGALRSQLGMGNQDFTSDRAMLAPASQGYSSGRAFWNLNLGGMGDIPLPIEGQFANLEISEIVRRFVPREPSTNFINPLPNQMGIDNPWLPGASYTPNPIKQGDPYRIPDAGLRLPGTAYRRTNMTFGSSDEMSIANMHQILSNVAPWSQEYSAMDKMISGANLSPMEQALVNRSRHQVEAMRIENEFTPYEYKYESAVEAGTHPISYGVGRGAEWLAHRDTFFNRKFLPVRTAVEDWERDNVYGATYQQWQTPIESFLQPMVNKSTQGNPVLAALGLGTVGSLFGVSRQAKVAGSILGGGIGLGAGLYGNAYENMTGERFMPMERRKELALETHIDILSYVKSMRNASVASQSGNSQMAQEYLRQSTQTMYGANLNSTPEQLAMAVPKRKREHFKAMLYAPPEEHDRILSTASVLERRLYEAAWGRNIEELPDLNQYFQDHELPPMDSEFWDPAISMDNIKIKMGQHMGLDMAQMGYYPQQIQEANLINPVYPSMYGNSGNNSTGILTQLQRLIYQNGGNGNVQVIPTPYGDTRVQLNAGIY